MKLLKGSIVSIAVLLGITSCGGTKNDDKTMMLLGAYILSQQGLPATYVSVPEGQLSNVAGANSATSAAVEDAVTSAKNAATGSSAAASFTERTMHEAIQKALSKRSSNTHNIQALEEYNYNATNIKVTWNNSSFTCGNYGGTFNSVGEADVTIKGTKSTDSSTGYKEKNNYTYTISQFKTTNEYNNCIMVTYDLSDPSVLTGNPVKWPMVYLQMNGKLTIENGHLTMNDTTEYESGFGTDGSYNEKEKGSKKGKETMNIKLENFRTKSAKKIEELAAATESSLTEMNASYENNFDFTANDYSRNEITDEAENKRTMSGTGSKTATSYSKMSGTIDGQSFSTFLNMSYSMTPKEYCEWEAETHKNLVPYTYVCN